MQFNQFLNKLSLILFLGIPISTWAQFQPTVAWQDLDGRMHYQRDAEGNRIPNFSHAGYQGGGISLPSVPVVLTISPIQGDNTAHLQAAIDQVAALPADSNGHKGAILLESGFYEIHGTVYLNSSGVVLRGVGDGADTTSNTVLMGIGNVPNQRDILVAGGGNSTNWEGRVPNTANFIASDRVLVGEYEVKVEHPEFFSAGDNIIINHPCTQDWLDAIDNGGAVSEGPWTVGSQPLVFNHQIVDIMDSTLILDIPVYNTLDKSLSPAFVYTYDRAGLVTEVGIENLRIDIETAGGVDEAHAWNAVGMVQIEDAWVKDCSFLHFGLAGVYTATANRITVENCQALDPVAEVTGARMYNFNLLRSSSQILFKDCYGRNGRHHYVSNGTSSVSGCVFWNCTSDAAYSASEGHRRWSMGLLYDNLEEVNVRSSNLRLLALFNRGDFGTAHGWAAAHSVAWNCGVGIGQLVVQKPPTAQNYAVGCRGNVTGSGPWPGPAGHIEGTGETDIVPNSLYLAQLEARQADLEPVITDIPPTSIENPALVQALDIYPNPSSGQIHIKAPKEGPFIGKITDLHGRTLTQFHGQKQWQGAFPTLSPGYYLIELFQDGQRFQARWVKQ